MAISVECPACEHIFSVPEQYAGKQGKCPECGTVFRAPESSATAGPQPSPARTQAPAPPPRSKPQTPGPKIPTPRAVTERVPTRVSSAPPVQEEEAADSEEEFLLADFSEGEMTPNGQSSVESSPSDTEQPSAARPSKTPLSGILGTLGVLTVLVATTVGVLRLVVFNTPGGGQLAEHSGDSFPSGGSARSVDSKNSNAAAAPKASPRSRAGEASHERLDQLWDDVHRFIYQVEVETREGAVVSGTGLAIDARGWLVTSRRLFRNAESFRARRARGSDEDADHPWVEGLGVVALGTGPFDVADFAIVAIDLENSEGLAEPAMNPKARPRSDDPLVAAGYPTEGDAWLVECSVNQVMSYAQLNPGMKKAFRQYGADESDDIIWINHSAAIPEGAGGGPLLNRDGEVIAVNIELPQQTGGFAVPIQRALELYATADDSVTPLASVGELAGNERGNVEVPLGGGGSAMMKSEPFPVSLGAQDTGKSKPEPASLESVDYMKELLGQCKELKFSPTSAADYEKLQELAEHVAAAQFLMDDKNVEEGLRVIIDAAAQEVVTELSTIRWRDDAVLEQVNQLATESLKTPGPGVLAYIEVTLTSRELKGLDDQPAVLFKLIGTDQYVVLITQENPRELKKGSRWLVLGTHDPNAEIVIPSIKPGEPERVAQLIQAKTLIGQPEEVARKKGS